MAPSIYPGSLVMAKEEKTYSKGNIIVFKSKSPDPVTNEPFNTVHRIVDVEVNSDFYFYKTKGDANSASDPGEVEGGRVLGKVVFIIPFLGRLGDFVKTQLGFTLIIIIPGTLIIYSELKDLVKTIRVQLNKPGKKKSKLAFKILPFLAVFLCTSALPANSNFIREVRLSSSYETGIWISPELSFYLRSDGYAVGFRVNNVADFDEVKYLIDYERTDGVHQAVMGSLPTGGLDTITKEWLILGTCSDLGEVCTYDDVVKIDLVVTLLDSGVEEKVLQSTIAI